MLTKIERKLIKKPQLGGWKHKITGVVYLNGDSQTGPRPRRIPWEKTCTRGVQTTKLAEEGNQTTYEQATQMWRRDCYIPSVSDKYVSVKPYTPYDEVQNAQSLLLDVDGKAIIIQRCYRAFRIIKFMRLCAKLYRKMVDDCKKLGEEKAEEIRQRYYEDCRALNNPRNLTDLDALIGYFEETELKETEKDADPTTRLKNKRRFLLLASEKLRHDREQRWNKTKARFLSRVCEPRRWLDYKYKPIQMLTLRNQAAQKLMELFNLITDLTTTDRLENLFKAREFIETHDCKDANALRYLVDQEIVMLSKCIDESSFDFLRKRILGALLQFIRTSHNCTCKSVTGTEVHLHDLAIREPTEKIRVFCEGCRKLMPYNKFPVTSKRQNIKKCKGCVRFLRNLRRHVDLRPYEQLLKNIREAEGADSLAERVSVLELYHLVFRIWHERSVVSENNDPHELSFPRYEVCKPWSPWNCILLTHEEAEMHCCFGGGDEFYSFHLRRKIRSAHRTAKIDFRALAEFEDFFNKKKNESKQQGTGTSTMTHDVGV